MRALHWMACLVLAAGLASTEAVCQAPPPSNAPQAEPDAADEKSAEKGPEQSPETAGANGDNANDTATSADGNAEANQALVNEAQDNITEPKEGKAEPADADSAPGLLSRLGDFLLMLAAGFVGGIAALLVMRFARRGEVSRIERAAEKLERLVQDLRAKGGGDDSDGAPGRRQQGFKRMESEDQAGAEPVIKPSRHAHGLFGEPIPETQLDQRLSDERDKWESQPRAYGESRTEPMDPGVAKYAEAIERGERPRALEAMIKQFAGLLGVKMDPSGQIIGAPYRDEDVTLYVFAFQQGDAYLAAPTPEYVSQYEGAWTNQAENPKIIRELFGRDVDDSGQLRLLRPAKLRIDGSGRIHVSDQGQLAGFRS